MTGVIWIVQVVHYPLFSQVGEDGYVEYQRLHMQKITWVVMPAMLFELITAVGLVIPDLLGLGSLESINELALSWLNLFGLIIIWASTALLQVPNHAKLLKGFEREAHSNLVCWNWIRTIVWSVRVAVLFYLAVSA